MDGVGLEVRDDKDESRFSQIEEVLDPRFSVVLLLVAVLGRRIERRDLELSREGGSSRNTSSLPAEKSLGADESLFDCADCDEKVDVSDTRMGVAGWDTLRRGSTGWNDWAGLICPEVPGHFRLPGRRLYGSVWSIAKARPVTATPMVPRAQSWHDGLVQ